MLERKQSNSNQAMIDVTYYQGVNNDMFGMYVHSSY